MKKSLLSELFLIFKPTARKNQNGNAMESDPVALRRLPIVTEQKKTFSVPVILASLFSVIALILFLSTQGIRMQNKTLLKESQKNKALIQEAEAERDALKNELEKLKKEMESLGAEFKKSQDLAAATAEEKTYLEEMLINKNKEIESLKNQTPLPASSDQVKRLSEQNRILSKKLEKLYLTTNQKIAEINVAKITLEGTIADARKAIDNEWNLVDLGTISANPNSPQKPKPAPARTLAKKQGKVLAINEDHGFVIVDLGRVDGMNPNTLLSLSQNGQVVGKLKVLEIRDVMTACNIQDLTAGKKIQVNDSVLIQK